MRHTDGGLNLLWEAMAFDKMENCAKAMNLKTITHEDIPLCTTFDLEVHKKDGKYYGCDFRFSILWLRK